MGFCVKIRWKWVKIVTFKSFFRIRAVVRDKIHGRKITHDDPQVLVNRGLGRSNVRKKDRKYFPDSGSVIEIADLFAPLEIADEVSRPLLHLAEPLSFFVVLACHFQDRHYTGNRMITGHWSPHAGSLQGYHPSDIHELWPIRT